MSAETTECPRCRLYQGEVALLRAEIAGLRKSLLELTAPAAPPGAAVLKIVGIHEAERLALAGPRADGPDVYYRVSLTYRDELSAHCDVPLRDTAAFLRFFEELARHKTCWEGEKRVASPEGQLAVTCKYEGRMYRPEVSMDVSCALADPSFDPYWTVHLHLDVDPELLEDMAAQARNVFPSPSAE